METEVTIGDAAIHCVVSGQGPPLALIHGFSLDLRMWDAQAADLERDHRVLRHDCRGFGRSSLPGDASYTHAEDLVRLLDRLGIERATLVGQSMGGQVALECAVRFPDRAERLVLVDPWLVDFAFSPDWIGMWGRAAQAAGRGAIAEAKRIWWEESGLFTPASESPAAREALQRMIADYSGWHFTRLTHPTVTPISARLGEIERPVLLLVGEREIPDFVAIADRIEAAIADVRREAVPAVGHMANVEAPERVNAAIRAFLSGAPEGSGAPGPRGVPGGRGPGGRG